jgi:hypothetical protein
MFGELTGREAEFSTLKLCVFRICDYCCVKRSSSKMTISAGKMTYTKTLM